MGFNPTEAANHNLEFFTPAPLVNHEYSDEKVHAILEWQRRCCAHGKAKRVALIMDDCMGERVSGSGKGTKKVMKSDEINRVFKLGRHYKIFYLNAMQAIMDAPPDVRQNVDLLFSFSTSSNAEREKLYKDFFGNFKSFRDFSKVFEACAVGYDCIVLDTRRMATHPNECIFFYKATLRTEPFHVGRRVFKELSSYYFCDTQDNDMDVNKVLRGGGGGALPPPPAKKAEFTVTRRPQVEEEEEE